MDQERHAVERAFRGRHARRVALGEPVAREARHDTPADERDQHEERGDSEPASRIDAQVKEHIAGDEQAERDEHRQIAPVAAGDELARHHRHQDDAEGKIDPRKTGGKEERGAAREPEEHERRESAAAHREASGPVRDRGQHEPCHGGEAEAVHHLMRVPEHRREARARRVTVHVSREPDRHAERRPCRGEEEEGTEPATQEAGDCHDRHP